MSMADDDRKNTPTSWLNSSPSKKFKNKDYTIGIDTCLDIILDILDTMFCNGDFSAVDNILKELDTNYYPTDINLAFLTFTLPAKSKLSSRNDFLERCRKTLEERKETDRGLLDGLE